MNGYFVASQAAGRVRVMTGKLVLPLLRRRSPIQSSHPETVMTAPRVSLAGVQFLPYELPSGVRTNFLPKFVRTDQIRRQKLMPLLNELSLNPTVSCRGRKCHE